MEKKIDELEQEIINLAIRLKRIEELLLSMPVAQDYISEFDTKLIDPIYQEAVELISHHDSVSASFLQRRLKIGYSRAARIIDSLEHHGVVGHAEGSRPRKVLANKIS